jgi:hypoxanthine phosphoribosyltransferase
LDKVANPLRYLESAELIYSEQVVNQAISSIAEKLNRDYVAEPPIVLTVVSGAIYFTGQLLSKLKFPLELDYVHATRYHDGVEGKALEWVVKPNENIKNRSVLILDDILDEGVTLQAIVQQCRMLGARDIKTAVLVEKNLSIAKPIQASYVGLTVPNRYVFGCGMDVYGWWRNLPAIYALNNH